MKCLFIVLFVGMLFCASISAQTTAFTFQGSLKDGASPANGNYDLEFKLFDAVSAGTQQGNTLQRLNVAVANGIFAVSLDFGAGTLPGADRFLDVSVRTAGGGAFTPLGPRQQITSSPYSVRSLNAATADSVAAGGIPAGSGNYIQNTTSPQTSSNFNISGDGTAGGTLSGNVVNSATQYNVGGIRVLSTAGTTNLFGGVNAGSSNTTGLNNAFFGRDAGNSNTTGVSNTFVGFQAGLSNTTASNNSFFGVVAGTNNTTGSFNTIIGTGANVLSGDLTNATAIGANALVSQSDSLVLGSNANVGIGTTAPTERLDVNGNVKATSFSGDGSGLTNVTARTTTVHTLLGSLRWDLLKPVNFAVGTNPSAIAFDGANVWVTNYNSNNVTKLRASDGALQGTFSVGSLPFGIAFDGANIWVTNSSSNNVTKLRASDGACVGTCTFSVGNGPSGVAFDGANIWVANFGSNNVTKLRASDGACVGTCTFAVGTNPRGVAFDGANIWVANFGSNNVTKLRASDGANLGAFAVGFNPRGVAFDGANVWVANSGSDTVTKLRSNDGSNQGSFLTGGNTGPQGVAFDGANIWVAAAGTSGGIIKLGGDGGLLGGFDIGTSPIAVAFDGANIWSANFNSNNVTRIPAIP